MVVQYAQCENGCGCDKLFYLMDGRIPVSSICFKCGGVDTVVLVDPLEGQEEFD